MFIFFCGSKPTLRFFQPQEFIMPFRTDQESILPFRANQVFQHQEFIMHFRTVRFHSVSLKPGLGPLLSIQ